MYISNLVRTARFRYTQGQKIGKLKNLKICRSKKPKGSNRIVKIDVGHLCLRKCLNFKLRVLLY